MNNRESHWLQFVAEHTISLNEFAKDPRRFLALAAQRGGELTLTVDDKPAFVLQEAEAYIALFDRALAAERANGSLSRQHCDLWDKEQEGVAAGRLVRARHS